MFTWSWFVIVFMHSTERNGWYATRKLSNSASNAMIDYSMIKCKLVEPRIGTGDTFSERSDFHALFSDPLKWRIWTRYQASTVRWKRFFKRWFVNGFQHLLNPMPKNLKRVFQIFKIPVGKCGLNGFSFFLICAIKSSSIFSWWNI